MTQSTAMNARVRYHTVRHGWDADGEEAETSSVFMPASSWEKAYER